MLGLKYPKREMKISNPSETDISTWKKTKLYRSCPVCSSVEGLLLGTQEFALLANTPVANRFDITACACCGFVTDNTPSLQHDYDQFYALSNYSPAYMGRLPEECEEDYFKESVTIITKHLSDKNRCLFDVGCGLGFILEELKSSGYKNLYAVDPSEACVRFINEKRNIPTAIGTLCNIPFASLKPDMITLFHVVEHLIDIRDSITSARNLLPKGGKIIVEVPDTAQYEEYADKKPLSFFYLTHVIHFDKIHLKNLFEANGFKQVDSGVRIRNEKELLMPCAWAVFEKTDNEVGFVADFSLPKKISRWFGQTTLDPSGVLKMLSEDQCPVYVWGLGIHAQMMLGMSPLKDCNIKMLVDKNPKLHGRTMGGHEIVSTEQLKSAGPDEAVFVAALIHRQSMISFLRDTIGFEGKIVTL